MATEGQAGGQKHGGLMVRGRPVVQLSEVGQRVNVVLLLQVGEAEIELDFAHFRANAENPLIYVNGLAIAMGFSIDDTQIGESADVARIKLENLVEPSLRGGIFAGIEGLGRGLKRLLRCIRREEQDEGESGREKFHEEVFFPSLDHEEKNRPG